ncbi:hypothetical protein CRE_09766 [Caenorhabditis remanei]|uniref:Uncharacterized protein n=1 Tax=Caenorhabditis remanei TaxID=31234 RepID=E3N9W6_CAERE|nr:hypothetical protein CRE_09766 [Caenorhabditis remanei]
MSAKEPPAKNFPLLSLPELAQKNVIDIMKVLEKYKLSTLSKRSRRMVKKSCPLGSHQLEILASSEFFCFNLCDPREEDQFDEMLLLELREDDDTFPPFQEGAIVRPHQNYQETVPAEIRLLFEVFNKPVTRIFLIEHTPLIEDITRLMGELEHELTLVCAGTGRQNDQAFMQVMQQCNPVTKRLEMYYDINQGSTFDLTNIAPFTYDQLLISNSQWLRFPQIISHFMDCKHLHLRWFREESNGLQAFLERWMEGCAMEHVNFSIRWPIQLRMILEEMRVEHTVVDVSDYKIPNREIFKPREQPPAPPITTFIIRRRCNGQETLISQNGFQFFLSTNCRLLTEEEKLNPVKDFTDWDLSQNPFNGVMERGENFRIVGGGGRCVVDQDSDSDDWGGRVDTDDSDSSGW